MPLTAHPLSIVLDVEYVWSSTSCVDAAAAAAGRLHLHGLQRRVGQDKAIGSSCNNAITEQEEKHTHFSRSCWSQEVYHFPSNFQIRLREKAAY